jgi:hypothetical protein
MTFHEIPVRNDATRRALTAYLDDVREAGIPVELIERDPSAEIQWDEDPVITVCFLSGRGSPADDEGDEFDREDSFDDLQEPSPTSGTREIPIGRWVEEAYVRTMRLLAENDVAAAQWLARRSRRLPKGRK